MAGKLVRDKMPQVAERFGRPMRTRVASASELLPFFKAKLLEESLEAAQAATEESLIDELADVSQVLHDMLYKLGLGGKVEEARARKFFERGGFVENIVMVDD